MYASRLRGGVLRLTQVRNQSSFPFASAQALLSKSQLNKKKKNSRKLVGINDKKLYNSGITAQAAGDKKQEVDIEQKADDKTKAKKKKKYVYAAMPRVEQISDLKLKNMSTQVLYSGYRPLFIDPEQQKTAGQEGKTLYEFAMKLEELQETVSPWVSSATGTEFYSEWDNVPSDVVRHLKPFIPPQPVEKGASASEQEGHPDFDGEGNFKKKAFFDKVKTLMNRNGKGGRKRPGVTVLKHLKKLRDEN